MEISYYKINPTGNITLIVETPVPRESQAAVAAQLMAQDTSAEQVGFLEKPRSRSPLAKLRYLNASEAEFENTPGEYEAAARLQMMGGEFCGNACIGTAAVIVRNAALRDGDGFEMLLEVSGIDEDVTVSVVRNAADRYTGTVDMPIPEAIYDYTFINGLDTYTFPLVRFPGICHVIVNRRFSPELAQTLISDWCRQLKTEALGLLFLSGDMQEMEPLVYVASTNTTVWETSCASGTSAVAAYAAKKYRRNVKLSIHQPGGCLTAEADYADKAVRAIRLTGGVILEGFYTIT